MNAGCIEVGYIDASDANLLVTYEPSHKQAAEREVLAVCKDKAKMLPSDIEGIFLLRVKSDARSFVRELREQLESDSSKLVYTSAWVPIDSWHESEKLAEAMKQVNEKMDESKSWKLELRKRHFGASMSELIQKLTEPIDNKHVDLGQPEQIVRVEILGNQAGVALLAPDEILNVSEFSKRKQNPTE